MADKNLLQTLVMIFGWFLGQKMVQSENGFRNISKCDKNNLINNFIKSLNMYFKKQKYFWLMSDLFQTPCNVFLVAFGAKKWCNLCIKSLLKILIYTLKDSSKFGGCNKHLRDFCGLFFEGNTVKMEHNLRNTQNLIEKLN